MKPLHFRCPSCRRLYSVEPEDIRVPRPEFECLTCKVRFAFDFPPKEDATEIPTQAVNPMPAPKVNLSVETFPCPACSYANPKGTLDCARCGVVFSKYKRLETAKAELPVAPPSAPLSSNNAELSIHWEAVTQNYTKQVLHEAFIQKCFLAHQLPFASQKYRQILESNPSDELAKKMRDKIIALSTAAYIPQARPEAEKPRGGIFVWILIGVGALLILTGLMSKDLRGVAGVGAAMVVLGIGARRILGG